MDWFFYPHGFVRKAKALLEQQLIGPAPTTWAEGGDALQSNSGPWLYKPLLQSSGWRINLEEARESRAGWCPGLGVEERHGLCPLKRHIPVIVSHWDVNRPGSSHVAGKSNRGLGPAGMGTAGDKGEQKIDALIPLHAYPEILSRVSNLYVKYLCGKSHQKVQRSEEPGGKCYIFLQALHSRASEGTWCETTPPTHTHQMLPHPEDVKDNQADLNLPQTAWAAPPGGPFTCPSPAGLASAPQPKL